MPSVGRGAAAAAGPAGDRGARPSAGPLHQFDHQRGRVLPAPGGTAADRGPGPCAGQHPGGRAGPVRPDRRNAVLPAQGRGDGPGQGAGLAAHHERGAAPVQHRPCRRGARPGRGGGRGPGGAGQHPVLRLGVAQPRRAAAEPGPARGGRGGRTGRARAAAGPHGDRLRDPRLLQPLSQALHGRVGVPAADRDPERRCPALPGRAVPAAAAGQRAGGVAGADLGRGAGDDRVPGHRLDAGALPWLPPPGGGLRRLPLPGLPPHRRSCPHRPGVPSVAGPRAGRTGGGRGELRAARGGFGAGSAGAPGPAAGPPLSHRRRARTG
ncbi:hypothetical protein SGPA1_21675 [Streptomyces misionensis JCM 4497]